MTKKPKESFVETIARLRVAIAAVDVVLLSVLKDKVQVFLIPVHRPPHYRHQFGLPGGVIRFDESAEASARRHLSDKVGVENVHIEQLSTFSDPDRDKRSRSISVAFLALVPATAVDQNPTESSQWFPVSALPGLAFDHKDMIKVAVERLKSKLVNTTIISSLLPRKFTLPQLQELYEVILARPLDKRNFRRKIIELDIVETVGRQKDSIYRPAKLYSFKKRDTISSDIL